MRIDYRKLNKEIRTDKTNRIITFFKEHGNEFELKNYIPRENMSRLNLIADVLEKINPGYRIDFRKLENR